MAQLRKSGYDPCACEIGVVHIGVGSFHRSHQALYFDDLLHDPANSGWAIAGVNLQAQDSKLVDQLAKRNFRYILRTITPGGESSFREIASIRTIADHTKDPQAAAMLLAQPNVQLVTMTVTESGYHLDEYGKLRSEGFEDTAIYPYLRVALNLRREADAGPITLLSCDNIQENSLVLKSGISQYLESCNDEDLRVWIEENVSFPCSMVDRITPAPRPEDTEFVEKEFGIDGDATVMAESFIQWVVEDVFAGKRPPLDKVGVLLTDDVSQYEEAKLRILNAGHLSIAFQAARRGTEYYDQAIAVPEFSSFFDSYLNEESIPSLGEGGEIDLQAYRDTVKDRFANPHIGDKVDRIASHGADKIKIFILPTIRAMLESGKIPEHALTVIANWFALMRECANGQVKMLYVEPHWEELSVYLAAGQERAFASSKQLWGDLPKEHPEFVEALVKKLEQPPA